MNIEEIRRLCKYPSTTVFAPATVRALLEAVEAADELNNYARAANDFGKDKRLQPYLDRYCMTRKKLNG